MTKKSLFKWNKNLYFSSSTNYLTKITFCSRLSAHNFKINNKISPVVRF